MRRSPARSRFRFALSLTILLIEAALNTAVIVFGFLIYWGVP